MGVFEESLKFSDPLSGLVAGSRMEYFNHRLLTSAGRRKRYHDSMRSHAIIDCSQAMNIIPKTKKEKKEKENRLLPPAAVAPSLLLWLLSED